MRLYLGLRNDPCFNLAAEEYLLEHEPEDVLFLWRNAPSVIIGKNQNAYAETDPVLLKAHRCVLVRRLTGGGAVYHDLGNLCFTFIAGQADALDFRKFLTPVCEALAGFGYPVEISGRNDLLLEGRKISGNAQCVYRSETLGGIDRLLHHGTILYDADLTVLANVLKPHPEKTIAKGIPSIRSRVRNLREAATELGLPDMDTDMFLERFLTAVSERYHEPVSLLSAQQESGIEALADSKYRSWEYTWGSSREYGSERSVRFPFGTVTVSFSSDHGYIKELAISGDFFGREPVSALEELLRGCRLEPDSIRTALESVPEMPGSAIEGAAMNDILSLFF